MDKMPLEIEYKYLIRYPDIKALERLPEYCLKELSQTYLKLPEGLDPAGINCRIRSVKTLDGIKYIKTFKTKITDMTRIEIEDEITEEEYRSLLKYAEPDKKTIHKTRHSFELFGFTYEVDVFPFWEDRAFLEIEVEREDVKPPIPKEIEIIKDVTEDPRYRNSALAKIILTEPLDE